MMWTNEMDPCKDPAERVRLDLQYRCPVKHCRAPAGHGCVDLPEGKVHVSRRVKRLMASTNNAPPSDDR